MQIYNLYNKYLCFKIWLQYKSKNYDEQIWIFPKLFKGNARIQSPTGFMEIYTVFYWLMRKSFAFLQNNFSSKLMASEYKTNTRLNAVGFSEKKLQLLI